MIAHRIGSPGFCSHNIISLLMSRLASIRVHRLQFSMMELSNCECFYADGVQNIAWDPLRWFHVDNFSFILLLLHHQPQKAWNVCCWRFHRWIGNFFFSSRLALPQLRNYLNVIWSPLCAADGFHRDFPSIKCHDEALIDSFSLKTAWDSLKFLSLASSQNLLTSEQSYIILKSITKLPIDLAPTYYPTLLTIIWENPEAEVILARDFDIQVSAMQFIISMIFKWLSCPRRC